MHTFRTALFVLFGIVLVSGNSFQLYGLDYTARRINYCPSQAQVNQDMQIISSVASYVRIYSLVDCNQGPMIMEAIQELNLPLRVTLGIWLDIYYYAEFPNEYSALQSLNNQYGLSKVDSIIVGSETQYRGDFSVDLLISFITNISTTVKQEMGYFQIQVTTADVIDELRSLPQLVASVDYVAYNQFAFWENIPIQNALQNTMTRYNEMVAKAQGKRVVISELGWPSEGAAQGNCVPSFTNENTFFQEVECWAATNNIPLYYFAAFDSLWQTDDDQKHWGLYNEDRSLKTNISFDFPCSPANQASTGTQVTRAPSSTRATVGSTTGNSASTSKAATTGKASTTAAQRATSSSSIGTSRATTMGKVSSTSTAKSASTIGKISSTSTSKAASTLARSSSSQSVSSTTGSVSSTTGSNTCAACGASSCCMTSSGNPTCYDPSMYSCLNSGGTNQLCGVTTHNNQEYYEGVCNGACYDTFCYSCSNNALQPTGAC